METIVEKLDLKKTDPNYYKAKKSPELRDLDTYYYLTVRGKSSPESPQFLSAIEQIYAIAYAVKFTCKSEDNDFVVPKMEAYWWVDGGLDVQHKFVESPRDEWNWMITIRMPDFVEREHYLRATQQVSLKNSQLEVDHVNFERINDGMCVQALHIGSYEEEESTVQSIMEFIESNGLVINGYHHEIYLNDPRKTKIEKLKTILRYAVKHV